MMEEYIAIMFADLSGYTALTEVHGAIAAADLIDKYTEIVSRSLVGDSYLHSVIGDEVVIVSKSPDYLIATAAMMIQNASDESNFLQIHGGLHYGKILKRNENLFGTTINLASRIASKAVSGTFLCSLDFIDSLNDKSHFAFISKGKQSFKNLSEENEVMELVVTCDEEFQIDPVCRMIVRSGKAIKHPADPKIFFCSQNCLDVYLKTH